MGLYRHDVDTGRFDACASPVDRLGILELVESGSGLDFFAASDGRLWAIDPADASRRARALHDGAFADVTRITALARGAGSAIWVAANGRLFNVDLARAAGPAEARVTEAQVVTEARGTEARGTEARRTEVLRDVGVVTVMATDSRGDLWIGSIDNELIKSINDRQSHAVGDRALSLIAGVLKEHIRGSDLAVRWGGDEFLVVTRSFQRERAADSAERLRAAVEALAPTLTAEGAPASTVSIGFAAFPFLPHQPDALTWEQTLELADHALRLTKRRQRNSYTGLRATDGLPAASVLAFLASRGAAPLPEAVEILIPDEPSR